MELCISNKIIIKNASRAVLDWCSKNLEFANPEFSKKKSMGLWTGNIDSKIVLWEKRGEDVILPYGVKSKIKAVFHLPYEWGLKNEICRKILSYSINYKSQINLFDYQEKVIKSLEGTTNGVIVMPCGSGKTQTALALTALLGKRTLWLTHTHELLKQSMERAKSCFNIPEEDYGTITQGKINVGRAITFATVQTMVNIDLKPYESYWDVVIVDECHKAIGTPTKLMQFYKVVSSLKAIYKYGLTATPNRNDGLERCMFALLGEILVEIPEEAVKDKTVPIIVYQVYSDAYKANLNKVLRTDGTLNFTSLIDDLCHSEKRNEQISALVNSVNSTGKTCLVLSDRVEHLEILRECVGKDYTMQIYSMSASSKAKQARKDCIEKLRSKQLRCLFATYQLAKEGLDIPTLDCVVFATPKKDRISVIQSCGRVGRKADGKTEGFVIDFVDTDMGILLNYARTRKAIYKNKKYKIV